ncbi:hypothetical protein ACOSQ3_029610 [Xanthoceras sorbifolium]
MVEVPVVQDAVFLQEEGSVVSSNVTELSSIQQSLVVQDTGEVNSPKRKRWKRMARKRASRCGDTSMGDLSGKRMLVFDDVRDFRREKKQKKPNGPKRSRPQTAYLPRRRCSSLP